MSASCGSSIAGQPPGSRCICVGRLNHDRAECAGYHKACPKSGPIGTPKAGMLPNGKGAFGDDDAQLLHTPYSRRSTVAASPDLIAPLPHPISATLQPKAAKPFLSPQIRSGGSMMKVTIQPHKQDQPDPFDCSVTQILCDFDTENWSLASPLFRLHHGQVNFNLTRISRNRSDPNTGCTTPLRYHSD